MGIEQLLRLTADYHRFCNDDFAREGVNPDSDELSMDELDFVAAAAAVYPEPPEE